jgi:hypothetical protein
MKSISWLVLLGLLCLTWGKVSAVESAVAEFRVVDTLEIDRVPSWFPVGFCLLTHEQDQYVAYYNENHQMIVAHRRIPERFWQKAELPSKVGWDSHNYITMAFDTQGDLHLSGNMHCVPLIYFRTRQAGDITSFEKLEMTGKEEQRCTYPRFLYSTDDTLLFMYRSGGSGNGRRFYNRYDTQTKTWARFFDMPLFEGQGQRNAYPLGPKRGPRGLFHLVWVWRDTPDCATNHHLSHAQSKDLKHWETAGGQALQLPFTLDQSTACVDPIPSGGGIINGCERLLFDAQDRPIIAYHKRDENGYMQIYIARFQAGVWQRQAITSWHKEIPFSGRGAMPFIGIRLGHVTRLDNGLITLSYRHRDYGSGRLFLGEETLKPVHKEMTILPEIPQDLMKTTIPFKDMRVKLAHDLGTSLSPNEKYILRWEALPAHHDRPRQPPLPPASALKLLTLERIR